MASVYIVTRRNTGRKASPGRPATKPHTTYHVRWGHGIDGYTHLASVGEKKLAEFVKYRATSMILNGQTPTKEDFNGGHVKPVKVERETLKAVAERFIAMKVESGKWRPDSDTESVRRGWLKRIYDCLGEGCDPHTLKAQDALDFYAFFRPTMTDGSIANLTSILKPILDFAKVAYNPFRDPTLDHPKGNAVDRSPLPSEATMQAAFAAMPPDIRQLAMWMRHGGLRPDEACDVKNANLVLDARGNWMIHATRVKGDQPRNIRQLRFQREAGIEYVPEPTGEPGAYVVQPHRESRHLVYWFTKACKDAGVPRFTPKILRKVHATELDVLRGAGTLKMSQAQYEQRMGHEWKQGQEAYIRDTDEDL